MRKLWTTRLVAEAMGVSEETVRRLAAAGKIPCQVLPSGHRRFKPQDILSISTQELLDHCLTTHETLDYCDRLIRTMRRMIAKLEDTK